MVAEILKNKYFFKFNCHVGRLSMFLIKKDIAKKFFFKYFQFFIKTYISSIDDNTIKQRLFWSNLGYEYNSSYDHSNISKTLYQSELASIINENNFTSIFELGSGLFANILSIYSKIPKIKFGGIDFASGSKRKYKQIINQENINLNFYHDDVQNIDKYFNELNDYELFFSFGLFMYLNFEQSKALLKKLYLIEKLQLIILAEANSNYSFNLEKNNIDKNSTTLDRGDSYIHNYEELFSISGFKVQKINYLNNGDLKIIVASKLSNISHLK